MSFTEVVNYLTSKDDCPRSSEWRVPSVICGSVLLVCSVASVAFGTMTSSAAMTLGALGTAFIVGGATAYWAISVAALVLALGVALALPPPVYYPVVAY